MAAQNTQSDIDTLQNVLTEENESAAAARCPVCHHRPGADAGNVESGADAGNVESGADAGSVESGADAGNVESGADAGNVESGAEAGNVESGADAARCPVCHQLLGADVARCPECHQLLGAAVGDTEPGAASFDDETVPTTGATGTEPVALDFEIGPVSFRATSSSDTGRTASSTITRYDRRGPDPLALFLAAHGERYAARPDPLNAAARESWRCGPREEIPRQAHQGMNQVVRNREIWMLETPRQARRRMERNEDRAYPVERRSSIHRFYEDHRFIAHISIIIVVSFAVFIALIYFVYAVMTNPRTSNSTTGALPRRPRSLD